MYIAFQRKPVFVGVSIFRHTTTVVLATDNNIGTHIHTFNGPFSGTSEWQWHQLGHMQVCTSLQTDNHANTPPLSFYRPDALPAAQPTASKH